MKNIRRLQTQAVDKRHREAKRRLRLNQSPQGKELSSSNLTPKSFHEPFLAIFDIFQAQVGNPLVSSRRSKVVATKLWRLLPSVLRVFSRSRYYRLEPRMLTLTSIFFKTINSLK